MSIATYRLTNRVVPKKRPRFNSRTSHAYHDPAYSEALEAAAWELKSQRKGKPTLDGAVSVNIELNQGALITVDALGREPRTSGADIDNLAGFVMDVFTMAGIWKDDRQVETLFVVMQGKGAKP